MIRSLILLTAALALTGCAEITTGLNAGDQILLGEPPADTAGTETG